MLSYITKKLLYGLLVLLGVVILVFFLFQGFGDPARLVVGQTGDSATMQNIRKELYLDQPKWKQFVFYLNDVSPLSVHTKEDIDSKKLRGIFIGGNTKVGIKVPYLRRSYQSKRDVLQVLLDALPGTMLLAFSAMVIATVLGILLGVLAAVKQNTWWDTSAIFASVLGISAPSFFMGIVIAYLFGFVLSGITGLNMTGSLYNIDPFEGRQMQLKNLI